MPLYLYNVSIAVQRLQCQHCCSAFTMQVLFHAGTRRYAEGVQAALHKVQFAGFTMAFDVQELVAACYPGGQRVQAEL